MKRRQAVIVLLLLAALALVGCADARTGEVSGDVLLDGQPVKDGVIRFVPSDGMNPTSAALVKNGKFRERVPVGKHRVEISAPKPPKGGFKSTGGTLTEDVALEELIPERYNAQSELTIDVKSGHNPVRYDLKSK